jgi:NAD(P)-dependent dehydrogenase (short-subunit alcohol dehydrogenase family)
LLVAEATAEQLDAAAAECRSFPNAGVIQPLLADLGQAGVAEQMVARAEALFGRVDILINNAATRETRPFGSYSREHFDRVVGLNLAAPFFASQAVVPIMRRQGGGRIIHIASQLGHVVSPHRALYGVTKAALIHLTKSMALELSPDNIIVNAISPGPTGTPRLLNYNEEVLSHMQEQIPAGRLGQPQEIAELAFYLVTSCPSFLRGQAIVIDGGYTIH